MRAKEALFEDAECIDPTISRRRDRYQRERDVYTRIKTNRTLPVIERQARFRDCKRGRARARSRAAFHISASKSPRV